jgi:hypothetical protein
LNNKPEMSKADQSRRSLLSELKIRLGTVIWFVLGLCFLLSLPIIFDWAAWVFPVILVIAAVLAIPTAWIKLKQEYERLLRTDSETAKAHANDFKESSRGDSSGSMVQAIKWLESGSESQKKLAGIVCRGMTATEGRVIGTVLQLRAALPR